jgi:hypothetical protein
MRPSRYTEQQLEGIFAYEDATYDGRALSRLDTFEMVNPMKGIGNIHKHAFLDPGDNTGYFFCRCGRSVVSNERTFCKYSSF